MKKQGDFFNDSANDIDEVLRYKKYNEAHCWQYDIRIKNLHSDLSMSGLSFDEAKNIKIQDFEFKFVSSENKDLCNKIKKFIEKHEWLGKMPNRPTHRFIATYKNLIVGTIIMATPNAFSNLINKDYKNAEKLIARGACISFSPKNTASWLLMKSIKWMVQNTDFRIFTAYSDVEAKELGTIYQACNFFYLGQNFGAKTMYLDPKNNEKGWFSDREFRKKSKYRFYATNLGISVNEFEKYMGKWSPLWNLMPHELVLAIKQEEQKYKNTCLVRQVKPKHKYAYVLGADKKETKQLKKLFLSNFKKDDLFNYPQIRGE